MGYILKPRLAEQESGKPMPTDWGQPGSRPYLWREILRTISARCDCSAQRPPGVPHRSDWLLSNTASYVSPNNCSKYKSTIFP